ncbi:MAG TPA: restriction endonuclease [Ottowia sp.]|nr:restriction endonuclease [Ottowia sp.]
MARQAVDLGLPPPMMLVSLLALVALAFGILAWPASRRTGAAPRRPTSTVDWQRLSQMANWFFDAHGLVRDKASRSWAPGASLTLHNGSHRFLVQTKQWRARQVDAAAVQRLSRELARRKIDRGVMLCAGDVFTPAARQLARRSGILLLDPSQLHSRSGAVRSAAAPRAPVPEPVEAPVAMPAAAAPQPVLRPDEELPTRFEFMPTAPMSRAEQAAAKGPVLRPDHEVRAALREFMPTVPSPLNPTVEPNT